MPESDREVTAMLSQAAERVGLEWRKPPCPEPSRLDDWFLGVACAGFQRPTGVPPVERSVAMQVCPYTVSTRQGNRTSSSGPVGTRLVSSGKAYVACGDAAST